MLCCVRVKMNILNATEKKKKYWENAINVLKIAISKHLSRKYFTIMIKGVEKCILNSTIYSNL